MKIIFAGTPVFSLPTLQALTQTKHHICAVYTQPDRPSGRGRKYQPSPVKQYASGQNIAVEQPLNFNSNDALDALASYRADLIIVVAYGIVLPETVLNMPRFGCINIHASLLPRWRGAAPIQRAILSGDKETGVTLMQMDKGLDTGDMLSKVSCEISEQDNASSLHEKLASVGANALIDLLPTIESDALQPVQQAASDASYAHKLSKQEAFIDWNKPAAEIQRAIQAFNPWPVAHTLIHQKPLRIWQARVSTKSTSNTPGQVKVNGHQLLVSCADGYLEIAELQPANKRRMAASDYLSAHSINGLTLG